MTVHPTGRASPVRNGKGRFTLNPDLIERDETACELRRDGYTYREIAERLGYANHAHAQDRIEAALERRRRPAGDELYQLELDRLDHLQKVTADIIDRNAAKDDAVALTAIQRALQIMERRARLVGLDAPQKLEITDLGAIRARIAELEARRAARELSARTVDAEVVDP